MKRSPIKRTGWNTQGTRASRAHSRRSVALADALARPATISVGVSAEIQATCDRILKRVAPIKRSSRPKMTAARKAARGKPCLVRLPGCDGGGETTVLAHYSLIGISGGGLKSPDAMGAWCCMSCHAIADGRAPLPEGYTRAEVRLALAEGVFRTQQQGMKE